MEAGVDFHKNESPACLLLALNIIILAKNNSETRIPQGPRKYYASIQELVRVLFLIVCVNYSFLFGFSVLYSLALYIKVQDT